MNSNTTKARSSTLVTRRNTTSSSAGTTTTTTTSSSASSEQCSNNSTPMSVQDVEQSTTDMMMLDVADQEQQQRSEEVTSMLDGSMVDKKNTSDQNCDDASTITSTTSLNVYAIPDRTLIHLFGMNAFPIAYGFLISSFGLIVLPLESERMWPEKQALLLACFLAICGVSQLNGPVTGYFSDRSIDHPWGKRRPYLFFAAIIAVPSLGMMSWSSANKDVGSYFLFFTLAMLSLNVMYTAYSGALTDLVNEKQRGLANGLLGAFQVLGASAGMGCFSLFLELDASYPLFAILVCVTVLISLWAFTEETPQMRRARTKRKKEEDSDERNFIIGGGNNETTTGTSTTLDDWTWREIRECYWIDRHEHYDFYIVFVSRTLYYMGVSAQTFMLFYFRDVIHQNDDTFDAQADISLLALIGQLTGGIVCVPMGLLSDRIGRKLLIYLSSAVIVLSYIGFAFIARDRSTAFIFGAVYGIGNGAYLSVDYALAVDTLPSKNEAARYLGIWGVGVFIGTLFGPLLIGPALVLFGDSGRRNAITGVAEYEISGYIAILMVGNACILLGAFLISYIKSSR